MATAPSDPATRAVLTENPRGVGGAVRAACIRPTSEGCIHVRAAGGGGSESHASLSPLC